VAVALLVAPALVGPTNELLEELLKLSAWDGGATVINKPPARARHNVY